MSNNKNQKIIHWMKLGASIYRFVKGKDEKIYIMRYCKSKGWTSRRLLSLDEARSLNVEFLLVSQNDTLERVS